MRGATLLMKETVIHDCAATGLYIGDAGSNGIIRRSNIIRNGGGSRRQASLIHHQGRLGIEPPLLDGDHPAIPMDVRLDNPLHLGHEDDLVLDTVPPGHSGKSNMRSSCLFFF